MPSVPEFSELLADCRSSAVHLEMRDSYGVTDEAENFALFLRTGERREPPEYWDGWIALVAGAVARGVTVRRARIVSEPVTDYIRYEYAGTPVNLKAGEEVRWLPRRQASDIALPGNDFWLFDDRLVRFNHFSGDGAWVEPSHTDAPAIAKLCADAFAAVWERAIPHAEFTV
ncbi:hypothetical protein GXP74_07020 [Streptacidiphilus sp. P02-A3a]|nr:DUF6879 family protein [Streptacidiphilus sp. P02-A3a]QMU68003.1 hypothetical protein GXP74_07020 [Streptacidiphilus sp. P02-A3a]